MSMVLSSFPENIQTSFSACLTWWTFARQKNGSPPLIIKLYRNFHLSHQSFKNNLQYKSSGWRAVTNPFYVLHNFKAWNPCLFHTCMRWKSKNNSNFSIYGQDRTLRAKQPTPSLETKTSHCPFALSSFASNFLCAPTRHAWRAFNPPSEGFWQRVRR